MHIRASNQIRQIRLDLYFRKRLLIQRSILLIKLTQTKNCFFHHELACIVFGHGDGHQCHRENYQHSAFNPLRLIGHRFFLMHVQAQIPCKKMQFVIKKFNLNAVAH
jgi:hypothetical protein